MMYHFIFGLRGGSAAGSTAGSTPAGCVASAVGAAVWFFSSSDIESLLSFALMARQIVEHPFQAVLDCEVRQEKKQPEQKHGDDHHRRRPLDFLARRSGDLLHLSAHIAVEAFDALRPGPQGRHDRILVYRCGHTSRFPRLLPLGTELWQGRRDSNPQVRFWRP